MWKRKRCKVYSSSVQTKMPKSTIRATCGSVWPILIDIEMHQQTTGSQMTGIAHQTVRVKNCVQKKKKVSTAEAYDLKRQNCNNQKQNSCKGQCSRMCLQVRESILGMLFTRKKALPPKIHFQKIQGLPCLRLAGEPIPDKLLQDDRPVSNSPKVKRNNTNQNTIEMNL